MDNPPLLSVAFQPQKNLLCSCLILLKHIKSMRNNRLL